MPKHSKQSPRIPMGAGHVPLFALGPEATETERFTANWFLGVAGDSFVGVIRFDLNDKARYTKHVIVNKKEA